MPGFAAVRARTTPTAPAGSPRSSGGSRPRTAERALELAASYATAEEAFRTIRRVGETVAEEDLVWCARESVSAVVPRFDGMRGTAARLVA